MISRARRWQIHEAILCLEKWSTLEADTLAASALCTLLSKCSSRFIYQLCRNSLTDSDAFRRGRFAGSAPGYRWALVSHFIVIESTLLVHTEPLTVFDPTESSTFHHLPCTTFVETIESLPGRVGYCYHSLHTAKGGRSTHNDGHLQPHQSGEEPRSSQWDNERR